MKKGMKWGTSNNKGLSPVIATVLLIVIVVIIALIVFFWVRGMTQEAITKFEPEENIQLVCGKVIFEATYTSETGLFIRNPSYVPIFGMHVKVVGAGEHETLDLREDSVTTEWPEVGLNQGGVFSDSAFGTNNDIDAAQEIILIPVLMGESESGRKTYVCDENQYGYKITV